MMGPCHQSCQLPPPLPPLPTSRYSAAAIALPPLMDDGCTWFSIMHTKMPLTNNDIQRDGCIFKEVIEYLKLLPMPPSAFGEYNWLSLWWINPEKIWQGWKKMWSFKVRWYITQKVRVETVWNLYFHCCYDIIIMLSWIRI